MDLIDKLPYFYDNGITRPIIESEQVEADILAKEIADTLAQCFVSTATWGLDYWEQMLGITRVHYKTYEERRSIIYSRLRSTKTTTIEVMEEIARSFFDSENVYIVEDNGNYSFNIELENAVFEASNLEDLQKTIELYKPAHLNYSLTFSNKGIVTIQTSTQTGYCELPICNVTKVGTWWEPYAGGIGLSGQLPQAETYFGYSALVVCGVYMNVIQTTKEQFEHAQSTGEYSSLVGEAIVGKSVID